MKSGITNYCIGIYKDILRTEKRLEKLNLKLSIMIKKIPKKEIKYYFSETTKMECE